VNAHSWHSTAGNGALSAKQAGRLAAALYVACGLVTALSPFLPAPPNVNRAGVLMIGFVAMAIGLVAFALPWQRWSRWASALLIPAALGLIALHNYWGGADPYRYGLFFMVSFIWVGLAQPRWTSTVLAPVATVAYLAPLLASGQPGWALASAIYAIPVFVVAGEATAWVASQLTATRADLHLNEDRFRSLVQSSSDGIAVVDFDGIIRYASPAVEKILGRDAGDLMETLAAGYVHEDDVARVEEAFLEVCEKPGACEAVELRVRHQNGAWRWVQTTITNLFDSPSVAGLLVNFRDITERRRLEDRLAFQALHDYLTGLPNRRLLRDRAEHALARAQRSDHPVSVLFIDLDGFKEVNDSLGHDAGDRLLCSVADRIGAVVRPTDTLARLGGDEFGLLLEDADEAQAALVVRRVLAVLADPFLLVGSAVQIGASIGLTVVPGDAALGVDELLRDADYAMYAAKSDGGGKALVFEDEPRRARALTTA
jgi:diguanylate cyclase (GGDEF)-like protein/PAS domain S-box-containing protein